MLALVYALLALAILIALLGIANTLALSIFERTRELGLLRAVGMTRSQLRSAIRWESVIIALQGTVLGLVIGLFFGWALVRALDDEGLDGVPGPLRQPARHRGARRTRRHARRDRPEPPSRQARRPAGHRQRITLNPVRPRWRFAVLEFDSAAKRFGPVTALDGCTFTARPGRMTGFLGPNGAGKTTAMRTVFGLVGLDAGAVRWRGAPISGAERARFGYMPEERGLYPRMRVREQLVYLGQLCGGTSKAVGRVADRWLERLGVADRASDRLDALSHGNQQRVQLIAALVNEPDLIVLDEPFSGLDPIAMDAMAGLLAELAAAGATVLFSSHQLDLVEDLCEDVVIIDHGRVVLAGELADLRSAVPERFVDVRYRGPAPDWSRLAAVRGRRGGRRPGPAAGRRRRRPGRGGGRRPAHR